MSHLVYSIIDLPAAYIDPNVGGWLFQLIFPVIVAIGGFGMVLRRRIVALRHRLFGGTKGDKPLPNDKHPPK